jgi:galactokinase
LPDHVIAFAPGRVNLIGEHTDYNQGLALPFAISRGVTVRGQRLDEPRIEAIARDLGKSDDFGLGQVQRAPGWRGFVRGAVAELTSAGVELCGGRLEISGDLPRGAGLSSSAALELALCLALLALSDSAAPDRLTLARLCSRIENEWVGAQTGLLDQIASLFGERGHAVRIDFRSFEVVPVELELAGHTLVTVDSGEPHLNAASGYNERRRECALACEQLGVASLRDATLAMADSLPDPLAGRARHVVSENARVDAAVAALERRDFVGLGRLLDASHASLRDDYEVSTPAVERTVQRLREGRALGARIVGGGFGGNVIALFAPGAAYPDDARVVEPGAGARLLSG